ncbi:MAG TPA: polymer-forming cytoskeletal protein [Polyangiaceae bacterium]|nr:polymer-forming cytoskeletal protein [Polyangiaceae bacterium]
MAAQSGTAAHASVIGRGTSIRGHVRGDGNLEVHGRVEGDVSVSGDLALSDSAVVRGNLSGSELRVAGTVQGDIRGSEAVFIEATARVVGDISAPRIGIASGALVKGLVQTDGEGPLGGAQPAARRGAAAPAPQRSQPFAAARPAPARVAAPAPTREAPVAAPRTARIVIPERPQAHAAHGEPARASAPERSENTQEDSAKKERPAAPPPVVPALAKQTRATRRNNKRGS